MTLGNALGTLIFFVNGKKVTDDAVDPEWTLLYYLRNKLKLCGTKLGCGEGGCGACTVMVSRLHRDTGTLQHMAVNACLAPVCSMHGLAVTTVEGIGSTKERLHPVQERLALSHGSQCGFCTPGIVMSMYSLLRSSPKPNLKDLEVAFQGNLCRCTGYRPIVEGFRSFVEDWESDRNMVNGNGCAAQSNGTCCGKGQGAGCCKMNGYDGTCEVTDQLITKTTFSPYDPSQEPIFPPELQLSGHLDTQTLVFRGERVTWYRPLDLTSLLDLKATYPHAKLVVGNTEVGLEVKFKNCHYPVLIQPSLIRELNAITSLSDQGIKFGASVTLTQLETRLKHEVETQPRHTTKVFSAVLEMLHWFAGKQIRNVSALGGNIMTSSPISDLNPVFLAAGCKLEVQSKSGGVREVLMDHNFFTAYRKNVVRPDEVLMAITVPYTQHNQYFTAYKQAKRREDDIAIVNAVFNVRMKPGSDVVQEAALAFGGMAPTTVLARATAQLLLGRSWNEETLQVALDSLTAEMTLDPGAPGGVVRYRRSLTLGFFLKFYLSVQQQLGKAIDSRYVSAVSQFHSELPQGSQYYQVVPEGQAPHDLVGRPMPHLSGQKHATGEAVYCDDIPCSPDELHMALVPSTRAHARLKNVDASTALALPGVVAFFSARDVPPNKNKWGVIVQDNEIFVSDLVTSCGQIIGAVVAETQPLAQRAAKLVRVEYEELQPIMVTIEDAIKAASFYENQDQTVECGDVTTGLADSECKLEGEIRVGGQEHFYLETHCARAEPGPEDDEMTLFCSTQSAADMQKMIATLLELPQNRVTCKVKRLGGGFGGKETCSAIGALPLALAAKRLRRPVRYMFERDEDMQMTGGRNPFLGRYQVGFSSKGQLNALSLQLFVNAGATLDYSSLVLERAVFGAGNAYKIAHVKAHGKVCRTNLPSNTALRGFGTPQMIVICETIMDEVAESLGMDPAELRYKHLFELGDKTAYGQPMETCTVRRCWEECYTKSQYLTRRNNVLQYNRENRWKKRGISMVPMMYSCGFQIPFLNQGGALVHIYTDGSVLLTHGGVEMGQGLHTKMRQVASRALGVPEVDVHIADTSTATVPNTIASAGSVSSDLNGMAILDACNKLMERLAPFRKAKPEGCWRDWVSAAYFERVSLSATGYYAVPGLGYNAETGQTKLITYHAYGVGCSEVEIDCLTGDHQILRTDIVMDVGESLNPAIDVGQVEGAFLQGVGLLTLEELIYSPTGVVMSRGPSTYKIPGFTDAPNRFNVTLLRGSGNPRAVYGSKAVGEPPLLLATSVFCAIRGAVSAARQDAGLKERFQFDAPATCARIRLACADHITDKIPETDAATFTPWNVVP